MSHPKLKPCPFCGGAAFTDDNGPLSRKPVRWYIGCQEGTERGKCHVTPAVSGPTLKVTANRWNKRARLVDCGELEV